MSQALQMHVTGTPPETTNYILSKILSYFCELVATKSDSKEKYFN